MEEKAMGAQNGTNDTEEVLEKTLERMILGEGDLALLDPPQRAALYRKVCDKLGLDPFTYPLQFLRVKNGPASRLILYLNKEGASQLRKLNQVSTRLINQTYIPELGVLLVFVEASTPEGRVEVEVGAVSVKGMEGERLANAIMHAITKAKRRATIAVLGLGFLDETEALSIPDARPVNVNIETGEIDEEPEAVSPQTLQTLGGLIRNLGLDQEWARRYASAVIGRSLASAKEMTEEEARRVVAHARGLLELGLSPEAYREAIKELLATDIPTGDIVRCKEFVEAYTHL